MIRKFQEADAKQVMQIWLKGNTDAHSFISKEYWKSNFDIVQEQLAQAEVYVSESEKSILGFIGITDGYIAGIFVDSRCRSCGIGGQLLDYVKKKHNCLSLNVYKKNERAVSFYLRKGFTVLSEQTDSDTREAEYTMSWSKSIEKQQLL